MTIPPLHVLDVAHHAHRDGVAPVADVARVDEAVRLAVVRLRYI